MNKVGESQKMTLRPVLRSLVKVQLAANTAFGELPKDLRRQIEYDMTKVATYIVGGESRDNVPAAAVLVSTTAGDPLAISRLWLSSQTVDEFTTLVAEHGGQLFTDVVRSVDFPQFVTDLISGVFGAIVDSSIRQMEAYGELVHDVASSVDQFAKAKVSENQARGYLARRYSDLLEVCVTGKRYKLKPRLELSGDTAPDLFHELGMGAPAGVLSERIVEEVLVPAARRRIAMDRQQLLASMVLLGINRIVVTNVTINASLLFLVDGREPGMRNRR